VFEKSYWLARRVHVLEVVNSNLTSNKGVQNRTSLSMGEGGDLSVLFVAELIDLKVNAFAVSTDKLSLGWLLARLSAIEKIRVRSKLKSLFSFFWRLLADVCCCLYFSRCDFWAVVMRKLCSLTLTQIFILII